MTGILTIVPTSPTPESTITDWRRLLPRSNTAHPDETLAGYVLNLAHRLDLTPTGVMKRTGLTSKQRAHVLQLQYGIRLPDDTLHRFTTSTGLSTHEAQAMTLHRYADLTTIPRISKVRNDRQWLDPRTTRYCPHCLAEPTPEGDEHPIWRIQWLTPWAIACPRHNCLLLDACPGCGTRVGESGGQLRSLIPHVGNPVTHPAACRAKPANAKHLTACDTRLDNTETPPAPAALIDQQRLFDQILNGEQPETLTSLGAPVTPREYLLDLRLVTVMVQLAADPTVLTHQPKPFAEAATHYIATRSDSVGTLNRHGRTLTLPPDGYTASTGLILTAAHLLDGTDRIDTINRLARLALTNEHDTWRTAQAGGEPSRALWGALTNQRLHTTAPERLRSHLGTHTLTFEPQHVPAYLPRDLYDKHFPDVPSTYRRRIRRHVPIALVRLVGNFDTAEDAGTYLGYNPTATAQATGRLAKALTDSDLTLATRVAAIAQELEASPRIDYGTPRNHIGPDWNLTNTAWTSARQALVDHRLVRSNVDWDKRRTLYAIWVWETLTGGDIAVAPMITGPLPPGTVHQLQGLKRMATQRHHDLIANLAEVVGTEMCH